MGKHERDGNMYSTSWSLSYRLLVFESLLMLVVFVLVLQLKNRYLMVVRLLVKVQWFVHPTLVMKSNINTL